jgi:hypothetical protein
MVNRQAFVNKLCEKKYSFKGQQKRTYLWKKDGGTHRVFVPMKDLLDDEWVQSQLGQMGCSAEEIRLFIGSRKN